MVEFCTAGTPTGGQVAIVPKEASLPHEPRRLFGVMGRRLARRRLDERAKPEALLRPVAARPAVQRGLQSPN